METLFQDFLGPLAACGWRLWPRGRLRRSTWARPWSSPSTSSPPSSTAGPATRGPVRCSTWRGQGGWGRWLSLRWGPSCSQCHQHFMSSFCTDILLPKNHKAKLIIQKLCKELSYGKVESKMLMKLTPWNCSLFLCCDSYLCISFIHLKFWKQKQQNFFS